MNSKGKNLFVSFYTTAEAMATEQCSSECSIEGKLVPVPRVLSAGCGVAWKGRPEDIDITTQMLKDNDIEWEEITIL